MSHSLPTCLVTSAGIPVTPHRYDPTCLVTSDAKVYHRIGAVRDGYTSPLVFFTACGKKVNRLWGINSIDRRRADLIARPCGTCFKERP